MAIAAATITFYWNDASKRWWIRTEDRSFPITRRVESTAPLDFAAKQLILDAICREMESWLF